MNWRRVIAAGLVGLALTLGSAVRTTQACPMCSQAAENGQSEVANTRPRAYMYSILFMLAVPAAVLAGFGIGFYRLSQKQSALNEAASAEGAFGESPETIGDQG